MKIYGACFVHYSRLIANFLKDYHMFHCCCLLRAKKPTVIMPPIITHFIYHGNTMIANKLTIIGRKLTQLLWPYSNICWLSAQNQQILSLFFLNHNEQYWQRVNTIRNRKNIFQTIFKYKASLVALWIPHVLTVDQKHISLLFLLKNISKLVEIGNLRIFLDKTQ